jgi:SAM-dependent methyltransferase
MWETKMADMDRGDMMASIDNKAQFRHAMLPRTTADEFSRQEFVKSLKFHLATKVAPGNKLAYKTRVEPQFEKQQGRPPKDYHEVRKAMDGEAYFQFWGALQRNSQEMMWKSTQQPVERLLPDLVSSAKDHAKTLGSLTLNADLEIPRYHRLVDIHCMPGGYHTEFTQDDVANGAVYDRAVYIYAMGRMGPFNSDIGDTTIAMIKQRYPDLKPKRILDMGCTVGHSTVPYADAFPGAEIHAIDVGAPVLRYAHARAEALGKPIHFSQQNAEKTNFPDGHFDLIVSHILVHETGNSAMRNIMKEAHRLLAPGGVIAHAETPPYRDMDAFDGFILDWDTRNNNEPYWGASHEIVASKIASESGFDPAKAFEVYQPSAFDEAEAKRTHVFQGGDFGGGGAWYIWGVQK